jgi:predicted XRE-type DNA-binding protein
VSYVKDRIAKNRTTNDEYRIAFDEEVELLAVQRRRREALMKRLSAVRKANHVTQQKLAEAMQISQARVSQLERGTETLSIDHFLTMLDVLGVQIQIVPKDEKSASQNAISGNQF